MKSINYNLTVSDLSSALIADLKAAKHAGEAEAAYSKHESTCFVPKHERSQLWMSV